MKEETYENFTQHEHVLKKPSTYIGSISINTEEIFTINKDNKITKKLVEYNPALLKIFDEILVNAIDHSGKNPEVTNIKVDINVKDNSISVFNDGPGIPVYLKTIKEGKENIEIYIPQMIFGRMLTSSNYDDTKERLYGGCNGIGGKVANIFSTKFVVETVDQNRKLYYHQVFENNMYTVNPAKVEKYTKKPFTKITFYPDLKRFKLKSITDDIYNLMKRRVFDAIATTNKNVKISFNNEKLNVKEFIDYTKLYFDDRKPDAYEKIEFGDYIWEISAYRNDSYQQMSFVNGIWTKDGGKHVECVLKQISKRLSEMVMSKKKGIENLKPKYIEDHLFLFVRSTINQPEFSSQSKESLKTPISKFFLNKEKIELSEAFINKLYKCGIVEDAISLTNFKNQKELVKTTDGSKKVRLSGIPNLQEAIWAGTKRSGECTLILTEGLSAMTFAVYGRGKLGPEKYGVFPLKGKILNVRDASVSQLVNNTEINNIKKILGLKEKEIYKDKSQLRYGQVMILTDSDVDGYHIRNLFISFISAKWPELLKLDFIKTMKTPIVKAIKGKKVIEFFNEQDYNKQRTELTGYNIKYYKGLGTSEKKEVISLFERIDQLRTDYYYKDENCDRSILLAFDKDKNIKNNTKDTDSVSDTPLVKCSDQRKLWLKNYDRNSYIDYNQNKVSYQDSINKELIHFSIYDNIRSIPSICDGLKPSNRKIMYYMLKKNITKDIKVAQLSGYVSAETSYHHGEASLCGAIINMAQNFVGSNNINLLYPAGEFGSRFASGNDAASPRYIFTRLSDITKNIYIPEDLPILRYLEDDGMTIEPEFFLPIIPMILINGCKGIGTGYSTSIPKYNPKDIIRNIFRLMNNEAVYKLTPWYNNFNGEIIKGDKPGSFITKGKYARTSNTNLKVTELPVGVSLNDYSALLDKLVEAKKIRYFDSKTTDENTDINFSIEFLSKEDLDTTLKSTKFEKDYKLEKVINTTNMHLFNHKLVLTKYESPNEILKEFYEIRLEYYEKRRQYYIKQFQFDLDIIEAKIRFIKEYTESVIDINKKSKSYIIELLEKRKYPTFEPKNNYDYLIEMPIISISKDRIVELEKQQQKKFTELEYYKKSTDKSLWKSELETLITML